MRVLVMDSHPGAADPVGHSLESDGHEVVRCRDPFSPSQPCAAYDGACPLDVSDVDVAVDVRGRPLPRPTAGEHGVVCAARAGVPVVIAGQTAFQPFGDLVTMELPGTGAISAACESAVVAAEVKATGVVSDAIRAATGLDADVTRSGGDVHVTVHQADAPGRAAVAAHQAVRSVDTTSRTVTIRTD